MGACSSAEEVSEFIRNIGDQQWLYDEPATKAMAIGINGELLKLSSELVIRETIQSLTSNPVHQLELFTNWKRLFPKPQVFTQPPCSIRYIAL
jgi:hypothetical protein